MSKRLDDLRKNYEESREAAAVLNEESAGLKDVLAVKQEQVMGTVRKDLREFAKYAADLSKGWHRLYLDECTLDFYRSSHGRSPNLIVAFEPGNVKLKANPTGYSHMVEIYDLRQDRWGWSSSSCQAYVTENWSFIAEKIEDGLAKDLEKAATDVVGAALRQRDALEVAIGEVSRNIDLNARKDTVLYNAISLLMDETWDQYENKDDWFRMLQNELGVSVEELEEMGIVITPEGELERVNEKPLKDKLREAQERAGSDNCAAPIAREGEGFSK